MDHLVNNAGIVPLCLFEDTTDITNFVPAMVRNQMGFSKKINLYIFSGLNRN